MTGILASFLSLPRWLHVLIGAGLLVAGFMAWDHFDDKAAVRADREKAAAQVARKAGRAEKAAQGKSGRVAAEIEKGNDDARNAAAGSDDPLRRGLDSLRAGAPASHDPAR